MSTIKELGAMVKVRDGVAEVADGVTIYRTPSAWGRGVALVHEGVVKGLCEGITGPDWDAVWDAAVGDLPKDIPTAWTGIDVLGLRSRYGSLHVVADCRVLTTTVEDPVVWEETGLVSSSDREQHFQDEVMRLARSLGLLAYHPRSDR